MSNVSGALSHATSETQRSAELVERLYAEALNTHDLDRADQFCAADMVNHHPQTAPGVDGWKHCAHEFVAGFPDLHVSVDHLVAQNDRVMMLTTWRGHAAAGGGELSAGIAELYQVRDGKIVEHWSLLDYSSLEPFGMTPLEQEQPASPPDWRASPTEQDNIRLVLRVWDEVMTQHRLDRTDDYYVQDYIQHNAFAAEAGAGLAGMKRFFAAQFDTIPDLSSTITQIVAEGDLVGFLATWQGHEAQSGAELKLHTADLLRVVNGRIAEHWDVFDYSAVARFGIAPPKR